MNLTLKYLLFTLILFGFNSCKQGTAEQLDISTQVIELEDQNPKSEEKLSEKMDEAKDSLISDSEEIKVNLDQQRTEKNKKVAKPKKVKKGKIHFAELVYDFGNIDEGDIIDHKFVFTNNGLAPLSIKKASATCGCTVPSYPFLEIEPGGEGHIGVRYNSVGKSGEQRAEITIVSDGEPSEIMLIIKGVVLNKVPSK